MKIVHVIFSFITGGAETMLVDIVNEQAKKAKISVVIINNIYNKSLLAKIDKQIDVHLINRIPGSITPLPFLKLNGLFIKIMPDIIHCHDQNLVRLFVPFFRKKSVLTVHDVAIVSNDFGMYKKLFSISKSVKEDLKHRTGRDSILVYNGINVKDVKAKAKPDLDKIFKIVVVSRLRHFKKGQHLVIEALNVLTIDGILNINVDFIGDEIIKGESMDYLKSLVSNYNLDDKVKFLGHKDRDYVYDHLCDYNLLIQPSFFEGFGLTVAEGMAAKIPVLVSNIDGPIEIIDNGKYGYYFQTGDAEKLAKQIHYIWDNFNTLQFKQKVEMAFNHVKENFDIVSTAENYLINY